MINGPLLTSFAAQQKSGTKLSGSQMQASKESAAEIMRQKQAAGTFSLLSIQRLGSPTLPWAFTSSIRTKLTALLSPAEAKKAGDGAGDSKK